MGVRIRRLIAELMIHTLLDDLEELFDNAEIHHHAALRTVFANRLNVAIHVDTHDISMTVQVTAALCQNTI